LTGDASLQAEAGFQLITQEEIKLAQISLGATMRAAQFSKLKHRVANRHHNARSGADSMHHLFLYFHRTSRRVPKQE
jgi:hypothetical protein